MGPVTIKSCGRLSAVCLVLALSGCISIPNSSTPRFYALSSVDENQVSKKFTIPTGVIVGIGPVKIPEYLDRPQIVTRTEDKMLQFAQFDRLGESLDLGLARLIREDLAVMLPGAKLTLYPWNPLMPVKYQVTIEVIRLESQLDKDMFFCVQWTVIDVQNSKTLIIKSSDFHKTITPRNYSGLSKALSMACASLSGQIAETLASKP